MFKETISKNLSNRDSFRIECQKCKCKKVELIIESYCERWNSDELILKCKHCGNEKKIYDIYK